MICSRLVVIAYGNPLRGDDGLGWHAAEQLKKTSASSDVEILQEQQLVPELALPIARAKAVIFVDAAAPQATRAHPGEIHIVEIGKEETLRASESPFHHHFSPQSLLALARQLYGARTRAFIATLHGEDFTPGERLSKPVELAMHEFVGRIENLILDLGNSG